MSVDNTIEWKILDDYPNWEMSTEGKVRSVENKKNYKKLVYDTLGRPVVVMYESNGYATCWYLEDLYAVTFGAKLHQLPVVPAPKIVEAFPNYEENKKKEAKAVLNPSRKRKKIKCIDTGDIFDSYTECAKHFGFIYDKFYYQVKYNKKPYEGHTFEEVD